MSADATQLVLVEDKLAESTHDLGRDALAPVRFGQPVANLSSFAFGHIENARAANQVPARVANRPVATAIGFQRLAGDFREPLVRVDLAIVSQETLDAELASAIERTKKNNEKNNKNDPLPTMESIKEKYGESYRNMLAEVNDTFENYETMFPALKGKELEVAGFVWFQGWNDQYNGAEREYEHNLRHFIRDVRKDLTAPNMPFVSAMMGQHGSKPPEPTTPRAIINSAQKAMESLPEFKGNVKAVATDVLVDKAAEELYPTWRDNFEQWKLTGGDRAYHYLGSAIWFTRIGRACGDAMIELKRASKDPKS